MMNRFTAVCALYSFSIGGLALRSAKGHWWGFFGPRGSGQFNLRRMEPQDTASLERHARPFLKVKLPRGTPYRLKEARWPDGSRAFLDSRGLLHVKFKRTSAEFSFVLSEWPSALWGIDGRMAGEDFFFGSDQAKTPMDDLLPALRHMCGSIQ